MQPPSWDVKDHVARLCLPRIAAEVNLLRPEEGLARVALDGVEPSDSAILQLGLPIADAARSVDHYVRGSDLIATYEETAGRPLRAQIYWRAASRRVDSSATSAPPGAIELVTSVQTGLLDSDPRMATQTLVSATEVFELSDADSGAFSKLDGVSAETEYNPTGATACFLVRLPLRVWSYAEMVHPLDAQASTVGMAFRPSNDFAGSGSVWRLRHELFLQRLEKGVILRARVLGLFLSRDDDMRAAAERYAAFCAEEPPLTT